MADKIFLIDGSGYIFRAYYAISSSLSTKTGFPTNALFGFAKMLRKMLSELKPLHIAVAFDIGRDTFRMGLYPQYKANRAACPDDLKKQMPYFRDFVRALGMAVLEEKGYEADDIIGTLATRLAAHGKEVVIVSGDKNLTQLIDGKIEVYDPMHDRHYRAAEVKEKFGVGPEKVVELLGLMGDSSDNVPGAEGVGPKTASQLIEKYGSVENVIKSISLIREDSGIRNRKKIADEIEKNSEIIRLSRKLVEIECKAPIHITAAGTLKMINDVTDDDLCEAVRRREPDPAALNDLISRFEFSSLFADFDLSAPEGGPASGPNTPEGNPFGAEYKSVLERDFESFLDEIKGVKEFSFDLETTLLDPLKAGIVGLSFCWEEGRAFYVPVGHKNVQGQAALEKVLAGLSPVFSDTEIKKCGQNLKFDIKVLNAHGVDVESVSFDSMVGAYLLNPDKGQYNLTVLASQFLGVPTIEFDEITKGTLDFSLTELGDATRYACQDAHYAWMLKLKMRPQLEEAGLARVADEIEFPLVPVLARMETRGLLLDLRLLREMSEEFASDLARIQKEIYGEAGTEFNINSPRQLAEVLFGKLRIPTKGLKKTKTGISTDSSVLEKLSESYALPRMILDYRTLHKLKSTYVDALPAQVSPASGRLHTKLNQCSTGTGRLSSSEPNLQNIPVQGEAGARIRSAFIPAEGKALIAADYSQIELRLLAAISNDKNMVEAFSSNVDIHSKTARELLHVSDPKPEERRLGKTINFGIVYGMGGYRLARELGIPVSAANNYIENYFKHYSGIKAFFDKEESRALEKGEVRTLMGRRRLLSEIDTVGRDQGFVLRAAMNAPIQGSAADVIKLAMVKLDRRIRKEKLPIEMLLQIHDELLFECDSGYVETALKVIEYEMEHVMELSVPLKVEASGGVNWQEAKS